MINLNKKAQLSNVMTLILILASAIVILIFVTKYTAKSTLDESINTCRLSVMTQSATTYGIISKTSPFDISCDKRYVNFYNTRVESGLSLENMNTINIDFGDHKAKKFSALNELVVDQVIAEELRICKFEFGDGKVKIFPNDKTSLASLKDKNVCFVCSEINFKPGVPPKVFKNLLDYTKQTTFADEGVSYYDYLTEETVYNESMWAQATYSTAYPKEYNIDIDTSQSYVVLVRKYYYSTLTLIVSTTPLGWFMDKPKDSIQLGIVKAKEINKYCNVQAS